MLDAKADSMLRAQVLAVLVGLAGMAFFAFGDFTRSENTLWQRCVNWTTLAWGAYFVAVALLVLTLSPLGTVRNNAQRWLWGIQPSELGKVAVLLMGAWFGARYQSRMRNPFVGIGGTLLFVGPLVALVFVEPDRGTAFLLGVIGFLVALMAGVRWWHMGVAALLAAGLFVAIVSKQDLVRKRIDAFRHPELYKGGTSDQATRAMAAFRAGGVEGVGLGQGSVKFRIPEQHTDFILPVIGEELGLRFTLAVVGAFGMLLICGMVIASRASDTFGRLLASGITFLIVIQALINIAVVTNSMPNKGMPLPFVSRGGSSIAITLSLVGMLLNVAHRAGETTTASDGGSGEDLFEEGDARAVPAE
jgi:cell division protein FtsW